MSMRVAERRKQRAVAARLLLSLHAEDQLDKPSSWTWEVLNRLPSWCLLDSETRQRLQLACGALFVSAELRFWIRRDALQCLSDLLGPDVLDGVMNEADRLALPREPAQRLLEEAGVSGRAADTAMLSQALLGAGAAVLSATVHESLPRELLIQSLGLQLGSLDEATATAVLARADHIVAPDHTLQEQSQELTA